MPTHYPVLRRALRPEYAEASDDVIETVVAELYGAEVSADDAEEFLGGIGRAFGDFGRGVASVASKAAPALGSALPGVLSGAATGAALGPWGALAGAAIGGVSGALSASNSPRGGPPKPRRRNGAGGAPAQIGNLAGPVLQAMGRGGGAAGTLRHLAHVATPAMQSMAGGGARHGVGPLLAAAGNTLAAAVPGAAGGQIAGLLARPEVQQAITSQLLGPFGRNQISVGGTPVPTGAVMNMLGSLFSQASTDRMGRPGEDESLPAYLMTADGEYAVDPADPDARAAWLAQLITNTPRPEPAPRRPAPLHEDYAEAAGYDDTGYDAYEDSGERVAVGYTLSDLDESDESGEYDEYNEYNEYDETDESDEHDEYAAYPPSDSFVGTRSVVS